MQAPEVLASWRESLQKLVLDPAQGYPGVGPLMYFGEAATISSTKLVDLRSLLDNTNTEVDRMEVHAGSLEETARKIGVVVRLLLEQDLLGAVDKKSKYPRLMILQSNQAIDEGGEHGWMKRTRWNGCTRAWKSLNIHVSFHNKFRF